MDNEILYKYIHMTLISHYITPSSIEKIFLCGPADKYGVKQSFLIVINDDDANNNFYYEDITSNDGLPGFSLIFERQYAHHKIISKSIYDNNKHDWLLLKNPLWKNNCYEQDITELIIKMHKLIHFL